MNFECDYPQAGLGLEIESRSIVPLLGCIIEIQTSASIVLASELWTLLQVGNKIIIIIIKSNYASTDAG